MSKKRKLSTLTGGTGDINPQLLNSWAVQTGVDVSTTIVIPLPNLGQSLPSEFRTVVEILRVTINSTLAFAITSQTMFTTYVLSSAPLAGRTDADVFNDNRTILYQQYTILNNATALSQVPRIGQQADLTDGAGHGVIVVGSNLYFQVDSAGTGVTHSAHINILYRLKNIGVDEFITLSIGGAL